MTKLGLSAAASPDRLRFTRDVRQAVADADFVQENAPERAELKVKLFAEIYDAAPPEVIIASSSSGIKMSVIQAECRHPERTIIACEIQHAIIGHRKGGRPLTIEAGVVRVADALDMEQGRSRVSFETSLANIHSLSAAAIDEVRIVPGEERAVRVEVLMNNSAGVFQVDELLASKLRGSGLEQYIEVVARIDAEHEKRLLRVYQI